MVSSQPRRLHHADLLCHVDLLNRQMGRLQSKLNPKAYYVRLPSFCLQALVVSSQPRRLHHADLLSCSLLAHDAYDRLKDNVSREHNIHMEFTIYIYKEVGRGLLGGGVIRGEMMGGRRAREGRGGKRAGGGGRQGSSVCWACSHITYIWSSEYTLTERESGRGGGGDTNRRNAGEEEAGGGGGRKGGRRGGENG